MKFRSLFLSALCGLAVSTAFTSCSDDKYDPFEYGSNVALPEHRGLVLNEGSYQKNNASIAFFGAAAKDAKERGEKESAKQQQQQENDRQSAMLSAQEKTNELLNQVIKKL